MKHKANHSEPLTISIDIHHVPKIYIINIIIYIYIILSVLNTPSFDGLLAPLPPRPLIPPLAVEHPVSVRGFARRVVLGVQV